MKVWIARALVNDYSENICVSSNRAYAMRNVLAWLTSNERITSIFTSANDSVIHITIDCPNYPEEIIIERYMLDDMLEGHSFINI